MLASARTLLAGLVDYAGLFPPAALDLERVVATHAAHRAGPDGWILGRLVVPAARLDELSRAAATQLPHEGEPWRVSAIATDLARDVDRIAAFNARHAAGGAGAAGRAVVDAVELKLATPAHAAWAASVIGGALVPYYEIPLGGDVGAFVAAIGAAGGRAKARTGGVTADAFPAPARLARFLDACIAAGVPFKATAGLHHPVRGAYRLTYEPGSACATMFGFLNVWLAAALLAAGGSAADATRLLEETDPAELRPDAEGVVWRGRRLTTERLAHVRERVAISFGSCSFEEPVGELRAMGWL